MNRESRHHVLWERRKQSVDRLHKKLRNHPGMVIPLDKDVHRTLHHEVSSPIVPSHNLALYMLDHLRGDTVEQRFVSVLESLDELSGFGRGQLADEAGLLAENLHKQNIYMELS